MQCVLQRCEGGMNKGEHEEERRRRREGARGGRKERKRLPTARGGSAEDLERALQTRESESQLAHRASVREGGEEGRTLHSTTLLCASTLLASKRRTCRPSSDVARDRATYD